MHLAYSLLALSGASVVVAVAVATTDLTLYLRARTREAREFAHRRAVRPWHLVPSLTLGDPRSCQSRDHNHAPEDFGARFRSRTGSVARLGAIVLLLAVGALALLAAAVAALVANV